MNDDGSRVALAERAATTGGKLALDLFRTDLAVETKSGKTDVVTRADRETQQRVVEVIQEEHPEDAIVGEEDVEPRRSGDGDAAPRDDENPSPRFSDRSTETASGHGPRTDDARKTVPETGDAWVIDPIDGTNNYVRHVRTWATSVAAVRDGETVAAANAMPALGDTFVAGPDGVTLNGVEVSVNDRADPEMLTVAPTIWWDFDHRDEYARACRAIVERFGDMRRIGCAQAVLSRIASGALDGTITNVVVNPWDSVAGVYMVRQAGGTVTDVHGDPWTPGCEGLVASNGAAHEHVLAAAQEITED